ncbi:hypothetical protein CRE_09469 [Caenorhabditis remanei]|uniref:ISXO2-like transposase domain-containing protein n=2 Tax=Caenorhabditis remanei TaxID=31234 RepID=E3LJ36_CAERE|nr:hypothetical protein CRE_09469 [Caenorhabditis remanei]
MRLPMLLLLLCRLVLLKRRQVFYIIPPEDVEGEDGLLDLEELSSRNLPNYIGNLGEVTEMEEQFLARYSLISNTRRCEKCPDNKMSLVKDKSLKRDSYLWRCSECKKRHMSTKVSTKTDSFFERSHLTPQQILYLAADWVENPTKPILHVARDFKVDKNSVTKMHEMFRQLTKSWFYRETGKDQHQMLGGPHKIVEIDETMMYRAKYNKGRMLTRKQVWVFGMIERGTSKIIMFRVSRRNAQTLIPIIRKYIKPGTTIISDAWRAYGGIAQLQEGYNHGVVTHKTNFVAPNDKRIHTQSIEASWGALKRKLKARFGDPEQRLGGHLFNYMFRRFFDNKKLLNHLIYEMKFFKRTGTPQVTDEGVDIDLDSSDDMSESEDDMSESKDGSSESEDNMSESEDDMTEITDISSDGTSDDDEMANQPDFQGVNPGRQRSPQPQDRQNPATSHSPPPLNRRRPAPSRSPSPLNRRRPATSRSPQPQYRQNPAPSRSPLPLNRRRPATSRSPQPQYRQNPAPSRSPPPLHRRRAAPSRSPSPQHLRRNPARASSRSRGRGGGGSWGPGRGRGRS